MILAVLAAVLFGVEICCLARGSTASVAMTLVGMRISALGCTRWRSAPTRRPERPQLPRVRPVGSDVPGLALLGVLDVGATLAYALASRTGLMSLVAVLASSYPAVTVVLARQLHGERLRRIQVAGVVAVLAGAAGSASPASPDHPNGLGPGTKGSSAASNGRSHLSWSAH